MFMKLFFFESLLQNEYQLKSQKIVKELMEECRNYEINHKIKSLLFKKKVEKSLCNK